MNPQDKLLFKEEVAEMLRIPPETLYQWRSRGIGPRATRMGRRLVWRLSDVVAFLNDKFENEAS